MGVRVHTIDELHRKMGHISLMAIKWLVEHKTILGLKLDMKSKPTFCPTWAKAKLTHKPIPQEQVFFSLSCWDWNGAIPGFWKAESKMLSMKHHVTIVCCESKLCDHHALEAEKWLAKHHMTIVHHECVSHDYHMIAVCQKWMSCVRVQIRVNSARLE